jgi:hypothetical protein
MATFRTSKTKESIPESITLMFRDLKRNPSIKFLWGHQEKILDTYKDKHLQDKDIAIELPTGTGKTLVGLLIAEYRRKALKERVVILCPTRQLCIQIHEKAKLYGIKTVLLIGSQKNYDQTDFFEYQRSNAIALTTYSGIFNTNPRINDPSVIICDDAHAADNYVASLWTVSINRQDHKQLFDALFRTLELEIPQDIAYSMKNGATFFEKKNIDLISTIACYEKHQQIQETIEGLISKYEENDYEYKSLKYSWSFLSSHLDACSIYCSSEQFEIRPIIPPTLTHSPFLNANQRIYMSATLGEDGDIERIFGIKKIKKLNIPDEWKKRSTGRRLILLPTMSKIEPKKVVTQMLKKIDRGLILVPDNYSLEFWSVNLKDSHTILKAKDIEDSLEPFTKNDKPSVLILATRYDGIDLPGDDCRFIVLEGMPTGSGLQEKYLINRLGVSSQLRNRIRTRVTQAMGRCTRDESDYSIVILLGDDLTKWCCTEINTQGMHPELQAEIAFGLDNSTNLKTNDFVELGEAFLNQSSDWDNAEDNIRELRDSLDKQSDNVAEALAKSMPYEIEYIYTSWRGQHKEALNQATKILDALEGGSELKPYVSFWCHQAAISAFLAWKSSSNGENFRTSAISNLDGALKTSNVNWLNKLYPYLEATIEEIDSLPWQEWFIEIDNLLKKWGIVGSKYSQNVASVQDNIENIEATSFENGLELLGTMLGAKTHKWNKKEQGKPDGLWIFGNWNAFVFEAKTEETPNDAISLDTVTQAGRHEQTVRADNLIPDFVSCSTIVISPRSKLDKIAEPHAKDITYLSHQDVIELFKKTALALEKVRSSASKSSDEALKEYAIKVYSDYSIGMKDIKSLLTKTRLTDL